MVIISGVTGGDPLGDVAPDAHLWPQVSSVRGPPWIPVNLHSTSAGEGMWRVFTLYVVWGMWVFTLYVVWGMGCSHCLRYLSISIPQVLVGVWIVYTVCSYVQGFGICILCVSAYNYNDCWTLQ